MSEFLDYMNRRSRGSRRWVRLIAITVNATLRAFQERRLGKRLDDLEQRLAGLERRGAGR